MRNYFMKSSIWLREHPSYIQSDTDDSKSEDNDEFDVEGTLFEELLIRVRKESKKQTELCLKAQLTQLRDENPEYWQQMKTFDVSTSYKIARQDVIPNGLKSEFSEDNFVRFDVVHTFNPRMHYDIQLYLNRLVMRANLTDNVFQDDMHSIVLNIKQQNEPEFDTVFYRRGRNVFVHKNVQIFTLLKYRTSEEIGEIQIQSRRRLLWMSISNRSSIA